MKICPQCKNVYPDDYLFCMSDGTTLTSDQPEQETVVREKIITPDKTENLSPDMIVVCLKCNLANRGHSKFCKQCGNPLGNVATPVNQPFPLNEPNDPPSDFNSSQNSFPPPNVAPKNNFNKQMLLIGGLIGCVVLLLAVIVAMKIGGNSETTDFNGNVSNANENVAMENDVAENSNIEIVEAKTPKKKKPETNTMPDNVEVATNAAGNYNSDSNANMGSYASRAVATTDIVVRNSPSPNAGKVAVFFSNSKMQILDTQTSETGTIWYRVRISEYGCSAKDGRCGKDDYYDSEEGWVYSNNVSVR